MVGDNVIDNVSQMSSEADTNVTENVSGQELNKANCVITAGGVKGRTTCQPALADSISEDGVPQSIKDTLSDKSQ